MIQVFVVDMKYARYNRSSSTKVIYCGVSRKRIWDFLLVINNNLGHFAAFQRYYGGLEVENCRASDGIATAKMFVDQLRMCTNCINPIFIAEIW